MRKTSYFYEESGKLVLTENFRNHSKTFSMLVKKMDNLKQ